MASPALSSILCPKCQFEQPDGAVDCPKCGIIFAKHRPMDASVHIGPGTLRSSLSRWGALSKEWLIESDHANDPLTFTGRSLVLLLLL
jgi:hypothetical protein